MKKVIVLLLVSFFAFSTLSFAKNTESTNKEEMMEKNLEKVQKNNRPQNIGKNNVGITEDEKLDQSDPTLIEGNLEDNDFKN
jgi:hypothetical protein